MLKQKDKEIYIQTSTIFFSMAWYGHLLSDQIYIYDTNKGTKNEQ